MEGAIGLSESVVEVGAGVCGTERLWKVSEAAQVDLRRCLLAIACVLYGIAGAHW